jgi:hypothetical protein
MLTTESRRALYRVAYPLAERPVFEMGRLTYEVVDCSEHGLRYEVLERGLPPVGAQLSGLVRFRRGEKAEVTGEVIRARAGLVVLVLDSPGIPFGDILLEQRYLRKKGFSLRDDQAVAESA